MASANTLSQAIQAHQAGRRSEAEGLYRQAIAATPNDSNAHYLLGAVLYEQERATEALQMLERAVVLQPNAVPAHNMLGAVYAKLGQFKKASQQFEFVAHHSPQSLDALLNLARACIAANDLSRAIEVYRQALTLKPNDGRLKTMLAGVLLDAGHEAQAEALLEEVCRGSQFVRDAVFLLGRCRYRQLNLEAAEKLFRIGATHAPTDAAMANYLGAVLYHRGDKQEAEHWVQKALSIAPQDPEILTNLGLLHHANGRLESAVSAAQQALAIKADMPECLNNMGVSLLALGRWDEALHAFDRTLALKPSFHGAHANRGHALLALGRFAEGWEEYAHRFDQKVFATERRLFDLPKWLGVGSDNDVLLIWTDQGLGDEILYLPMVSEAAARVKRCVLECSPRIQPLLQRSLPNVTVVARQTVPDPAIAALLPTHQISLPELGAIFRRSSKDFHAHQGYLKCDDGRRRSLRSRYLALAQGRKVIGVSWKSESPTTGPFKSTLLHHWRSILSGTDAIFVSLQYGAVAADIAELRRQGGPDIIVDQDVNAVLDPEASAAQIGAMDLVITTSNTTAHFAGAQGVPTWTLIPTGPGALWYWFLSGETSPWYPSMRLFRQPTPGDWSAVIADVAVAVREWCRK